MLTTKLKIYFNEAVIAFQKGEYDTAMRIYNEIAVLGHADAQFNLASMYSEGRGVAADLKEAARWYRLAAAQGNVAAQLHLGCLYGTMDNFEEALKWFRLPAVKGNADAQYAVGAIYYNGQGTDQDYKKALKWFQLAAAQGNATAQCQMGKLYSYGRGVVQDIKDATKWYKLAAAQGDTDAMYELGEFSREDTSAVRNLKEAIKWYQQAAAKGNIKAQFNLGKMYADGYGVPANSIVAYALWTLAKTGQHNDHIMEGWTELGAALSQDELNKAAALLCELAKPGNLIKALKQYTSGK